MKYKGFSIYLKDRQRADGTTYIEYRIVPPKGVEWPADKPKSGPGLRTEKLTIELAQREVDKVENRQYNIDIGRAVNSTEAIDILFTRYVEWGRVYGGKKKLGWNPKTLRAAPDVLARWKAELGLETVSDIKLLGFERAVAARLEAGEANGTILNHASYLRGFAKWAKDRKLLAEDPLVGWAGLEKNSKEIHGTPAPHELRILFDSVSLKRKIIYGLAYFCRARRTAIAKLKVKSMDWVLGGFMANYRDIKSRDKKKAFVPVPQPLLGWIWEDTQGRAPEEPLTAISKNNAIRYYRKDLKRAGLPLERDGLPFTFHGLGAGTATHAADAGVSPFALMDLMGHSDLETTRIYLRERAERIQAAQRPLVLGLFPELGKNWHQVGTEEGEPMQVLDLHERKLERIAGLEPGNARNDQESKAKRNAEKRHPSKIHALPQKGGNTGKIPYEDGQKILARVWHRLGDPAYRDFLSATLGLPAEDLKAIASLYGPARASKAGA